MLATVKGAVKAIVPQSFINWGTHKAYAAMLAAIPSAIFNVKNLGTAIDLDGLFRSKISTWNGDHAAISAVYGSAERLGGVNPGDRRALYYLVRILRPARVLEIGTHVGASTLYIARAIRANGSGALSTVDIVDVNDPRAMWRKVGLPASPLGLARQSGCADTISFVVSDAQTFMKRGGQFDFIFLDGDHRPVAVYKEVALALRLLAPGGRILLHDYYPEGKPLVPNGDFIHGPYLALNRAIRECPSLEVQPLGALPWPTKHDSNVTSLALVVRRDEGRVALDMAKQDSGQ